MQDVPIEALIAEIAAHPVPERVPCGPSSSTEPAPVEPPSVNHRLLTRLRRWLRTS